MTASQPTPTEILLRLFATFKSQDRAEVETLLSADFTFSSPYDNAVDREYYLQHCWPNASHLQELRIERLLVDGDQAYVTYWAETAQGMSFRNTEFFRFEGQQIACLEVYFGAAYDQGQFARMR